MNKAFWLLLFFAPSNLVGDDGVTGIFLTVECRKDIPKRREMLSTKSICVTQSPIINPKEFETIGNVKELGSNVFFDLKFTPKGYETLMKLTANLPDSKLALIVEDQVFFVFKASELKVAPTFRFQTVLKFKNQMETVHKQLVSAMEASAVPGE
jgi:hypothetical protein